MKNEITRLGLDDYEACLDFLKMSFNEYDHWVDFDKELPKAFRPKQELMEQNLVLRNGSEILALVGIYPMDLVVDGRIIRCATVGNVATRPDARGNGYMRLLMTEALHEVDQRGFHMTRLGGLRQRYNRYGFEYGGLGCKYEWNLKNSQEYINTRGCQKFIFVPLDEDHGDLLNAAFVLYKSTACNVDRIDSETFLCVLRAHSMEPWAAISEDGLFAGYVTASADHKTINEQYALDDSRMADLTISWLKQHNLTQVELYLKCWDRTNITISQYAESYTIMHTSMFRIHDWEAVIEPFLQWKNKCIPLADGEMVLSIGADDRYLFSVCGETASCKRTSLPADLEVDRLTATRMLFGILPPELVVSGSPELLSKLSAWLPLPLSWSRQDNV